MCATDMRGNTLSGPCVEYTNLNWVIMKKMHRTETDFRNHLIQSFLQKKKLAAESFSQMKFYLECSNIKR